MMKITSFLLIVAWAFILAQIITGLMGLVGISFGLFIIAMIILIIGLIENNIEFKEAMKKIEKKREILLAFERGDPLSREAYEKL